MGRLQSVKPRAHRRADAKQLAKAPREIVSPYLNAREAVTYLRLPSLRALYHQINRNRLPTLRRGGGYLFDTRELDAWVRESRGVDLVAVQSRRHAQQSTNAQPFATVPKG